MHHKLIIKGIRAIIPGGISEQDFSAASEMDEFSSKELAINYAKKKKIDFDLIEPKKRKTVKKSYADNFLK